MLGGTSCGLGDHTAGLMDLPAGRSAELEGPYGTFSHLALANSRQVWIAGGVPRGRIHFEDFSFMS